MNKLEQLIVRDRILTGFSSEPIRVGTQQWYAFLRTGKKFRYEPAQRGSSLRFGFSCRNNLIRDNFYWYAYRKVNGKLRQEYIGTNENMDYQRLQDVADRLSLDDYNYWNLKNRQKREKKQKKISSLATTQKSLLKVVEKIDLKQPGYTPDNAQLLIQDIQSLSNEIKLIN